MFLLLKKGGRKILDKKVLKFELSPQSLKIKNVLRNDFIAIDVYAISDVYPNRNNSHFTIQAMKDAKPTFYNKPALGAFDVSHDDFKAHEMEYKWDNELQQDYFDFTNGKCEVPLGVIRSEDLVEVVEYNGQTWVHFTCVLWAKYAYKQVKRLLKDSKKKISVEIEVLESHTDASGIEVIDKFVFDGFTILGSAVTEAIPNAHLTILDKINDAVYQKQEKCLSFAYKELEENSDADNKSQDFDSPEKEDLVEDTGVANEGVEEIQMEKEQRGEESKTMTYEEKRQLLESFLNGGKDENASLYAITNVEDDIVYFSFENENYKANYSIDEENSVNINLDEKEKIVFNSEEESKEENKEEESKECESEGEKCEVCGNNPCTCSKEECAQEEGEKENCAHEDSDGNKDEGHFKTESEDEDNDDDSHEDEPEDEEDDKKEDYAATDVTIDEKHEDNGEPEGEKAENPENIDPEILDDHDNGSTVTQNIYYSVGDENLTADELYERFNTLNDSFAELTEKYNTLNAQFSAKKNEELYVLACSLIDSEEDLIEEDVANIKAFMKENCENSVYASNEELSEAVDHKIADALYAQKKLNRKNKNEEFSANIIKTQTTVNVNINDSTKNLKNAMKNLNKI